MFGDVIYVGAKTLAQKLLFLENFGVATYIYIHIHTYIYYLLRQVGLWQPKGWSGPADNLIKFKKKTIFI